MNDINKNEQKSSRFISLGACTVDAILKVDHIPSGDAKIMAEDGVVIGAGMAVAAASAYAASLLEDKPVLAQLTGMDGGLPWIPDLLAEARHEAPPGPSRLPLRSHAT